MKKHILSSLLLLVSIMPIFAQKTGTIAKNGMVSTAHPVASRVGLDILKKGGNAFDAAVAVKFALAVVYPRAGNISGGGFLVYRTASGENGSLDFRERAPLSASRDMYLDKNGNVIKNLSLKGALAVGVPGTVDGMYELWSKKGKLPWKALIQPSVDLAQNGFELTKAEADKLNIYQDVLKEMNGAPNPYISPAGKWKKGDRIINKSLANTLTAVRDNGRAGFYEGKVADDLVNTIQKNGGILSHKDLREYKSIWRGTISADYRGYTIHSMPPPSSGGIALAQLFTGSEMMNLSDYKHNSPDAIHLMTELERRVYADRATHLGDPDFYDVPQAMLLDREYLRKRFSDIRMDKKTDSQRIKPGKVNRIESLETTHLSIVDKDGNAASITTSLNGNYGSKLMAKEGGYLLNNVMDDFSSKPGTPNQFGLVGAEANAIAPGKRMLSSMSPSIVEKDGKLFMVVGTPGGSTIITSVYQTILNIIDHGMSMREAVDAKKFHSQWLPDVIVMEEKSFSSETLDSLRKRGHKLKFASQLGRMDCVLVRPDGSLEGASDTNRSDGQALGY
ncbi:gamma-glutamyltransferase (plasmid) [Fulvitalea axinellae]|uniref:Glutathione hydrolase proenzyme n=1 Tax=Fulvitalea axinellae TaxID=1182444 RepID=A0AAU9CQS4_9BACT|nr:gamma-glutamyltransferase [Fulvitalea axinellae]